jgi:uncharacterized protein YgbK (DUF1537 family)
MLVEERPLAIIADDLTGACDAACQFRQYGLPVVVTDAARPVCDSSVRILAVNSDSRKQSSAAASMHIQEICKQLLQDGRIPFYKKIDSTLKGNWCAELAAVVSTWIPEVVLVAPAFPIWGRTTEDGIQHLNGRSLSEAKIHHSGRPTDSQGGLSANLVEILKQQFGWGVQLFKRTQLSRGPQWVERQIERYRFKGSRFLVFDAASDEDLKCICLGGSGIDLKALWVGSGGLARFLPLGWGYRVSEPILSGPELQSNLFGKSILLVNGSLNPSNAQQLRHLLENGRALIIEVEENDSERNPMTQAKRANALRSLEQGLDVVISFPFSTTLSSRAHLQEFHDTLQWLTSSLMDSERVGGLIIVGGDTATKVYRRAGASGIEILGEVQPGVPFGRWIGGLLAGRPVITKAGGFGQLDTLTQAVEVLKRIAE